MAQGAARKQKKKKKSVLKRIRQTIHRTEVNRANRSRVRTAIKKMRATLAGGDVSAAEKLVSPTMAAIDNAIRLGALKENTGNRYKSRMTLAVHKLRRPAKA
ncbi:MAG: 30S ribosomal protein S20 [Acidipila sp.]|nr:30S ribosomal protein S20 [Acidipila sp.]